MNQRGLSLVAFSRKYFSCLLLLFIVSSSTHALQVPNALQEYIELDDEAYSYEVVSNLALPGATAYIVRMTSQHWRSDTEVDRTLWEHAMTVVVPDTVASSTAVLFIDSGDNLDDFLAPDDTQLQVLVTLATATNTIAAAVGQVPNQPLTFLDEPDEARFEDDLVAYSWDMSMGTGDLIWSAYVPMAKSAIKALDTVENVAADLEVAVQPEQFAVFGFSKRGAATWFTAVFDERVVAISPGVFDTLNFAPSLELQRLTYGEFAAELVEYDTRKVLDRFRTKEGKRLAKAVDPYVYRDLVDIPKYIINTSGDQFYPASTQFYLSELQGESLIRYVPNTGHSGENGGFENAIFGLVAWYQRIVSGTPRPGLSWDFDTHSKQFSVETTGEILSVTLYTAENPEARDFRFPTFGPNWQAQTLTPGANGAFNIPINDPVQGWKGYFVEIAFQGVSVLPEVYSTPIFITPDEFAFTLEQPVLDPRNKQYWQQKLADMIDQGMIDQELSDSFPIRILGRNFVNDIESALDILSDTSNSSRKKALQECLVTRLNIKDGQLGWYSRFKLWVTGKLDTWKIWNIANRLFKHDFYYGARSLCKSINAS